MNSRHSVSKRFAASIAAAALFTAAAHAATATPPVPVTVVSPVSLPAWSENTIVDVAVSIDGAGTPVKVTTVKLLPAALSRPVVDAVKQWRFRPKLVDGQPVASKVIIPIQLVRETGDHPSIVAALGNSGR